jgi:hypothetical protein
MRDITPKKCRSAYRRLWILATGHRKGRRSQAQGDVRNLGGGVGRSREGVPGLRTQERKRLALTSQIGDQPQEAFILMILVMAVYQRGARIVGDEINLDAAHPRHVDRILHHTGGILRVCESIRLLMFLGPLSP